MVKKINEKRKEKPGKVAKYEGKTKEQIIAAEKRKLGGIYKKLDEKTKKELEEIYPDSNIICDPLSLSVSCHIGPHALAVAACKKII